MSVDAINDFALFRLGVWGDGESWACRSGSGFGGWRARGSGDDGFCLGVGEVSRSGGRVHERDGRGTEFCLGRDDFDAVAEDVDGGRHVMVGK